MSDQDLIDLPGELDEIDKSLWYHEWDEFGEEEWISITQAEFDRRSGRAIPGTQLQLLLLEPKKRRILHSIIGTCIHKPG